jgi:trigger factor
VGVKVKVTREKTENCQVFLTIEMEPTEVEESLEKSYHRLVKKADIPGFRRGKAPRAVLERSIGKEALLDDALDKLLPQAYEKAIQEQGIEAIAQASVEIAQTDPVVFKVTVPIKPVIELGDYRNIQVEPQVVEVAEDNVNAVVEQLRHQHAVWEPVERPVEFNDLLALDIESNIEDKPFINQKGAQYQVLQGLPSPVPGFAEQLVGMRRDEGKEFKLQIPSDYPRSELAGKESSFRVSVTEIKQEVLPELNDEFAKEVSPDSKTLDLLREQISTNLRLRAEERARTDFEERVVEAVVDLARLEFPPVLLEREIGRLLNEQLSYLQRGNSSLEEYLSSKSKTEEELREELRPRATKRITQSLVLGKIAEEEKIEVSDSEIQSEIESMTKSATDNKELLEFLKSEQAHESIEQMLLTRKTVQHLVEIAKGSNTQTT